MLKTITLLLIIPCFCWGQKTIVIKSNGQTKGQTGLIINNTYGEINGDVYIGSSGNDTTKVFILYCDKTKPNSPIKWMKGFEVETDEGEIIFLDDRKKPLSNNIIVWQVKN